MSNQTVKVVYKKLQEQLKNKGYVNLNHKVVNSQEDLVQLAQIFRDPRYETFRVIYMKKNQIVGYESISTRTPNSVQILQPDKSGRINQERCYAKFESRMKRLDADGYYLVHNHPSDNAKASRDDVRTTEYIAARLPGFRGHLVVNHESYAWIDIGNDGYGVAENYIPINKNKVKKMEKEINNKSIFDVQIKSREDFVSVVCHIKNTKEYSTAIMTDSTGRIRMILDVPNKMLNENTSQLKGYFRNLARMNGSVRVFFATEDEKTYKKSLEHLKEGTFKDSFHYVSRDDCDSIYIYSFNDKHCNKELFDDEIVPKKKKVKEEEIKYSDSKDLKEKNIKIEGEKFKNKKYGEIDKFNKNSKNLKVTEIKIKEGDKKVLKNNKENKNVKLKEEIEQVVDEVVQDMTKEKSKEKYNQQDVGYFTDETINHRSPLFYKEANQDENQKLTPVRKGYLRGLYKVPGQEPIIIQVKNTLEAKQALVGGLIEITGIDDETLIVCNEEGKIMNLPPNVMFDYDFIAGPMIVLGDDYENGDFKSLTRKQISDCKKLLKYRSFSRDNLYNCGFSNKELSLSNEFIEKNDKELER